MQFLEDPKSDLAIARLGRQPFQKVWDLQRGLQSDLMSGNGQETLILCEHPPVITLGRSAKPGNVLLPPERLAQLGIEVYELERGGDVTFHGPGQLVAYPIIDLRKRRTDVSWYIRMLEETIIRTLQRYHISGERIKGRAGVWLPPLEPSGSVRKIAAVGVRISRWCTMHGISLNVQDCSRGFSLINPCGFHDIEVTSIAQIIDPAPDLAEVTEEFANEFMQIFCA